jgi:hypothetical protein
LNIEDRRAICTREFIPFILVTFALIGCLFSGVRDVAAQDVATGSQAGHNFDLIHGEEAESRAGHGWFGLSYQYVNVDGFESSVGKLDTGTVDSHALIFDIEYFISDKIALFGGIPYFRKKHVGADIHNPLNLEPPRPYIENVDDGTWNTGFEDFLLGVRYLAKDGPFVIEPFASFGVPSNQYPFFGAASVGQRLFKFQVGSAFAWYPGLSNAYYRADVSYVFVEKTLGVNINHWRVNAEAGYRFTPRLTGRAFMILKDGKGLSVPGDFTEDGVFVMTDERWYQHDRLIKHNFLNAGIGLDWAVNEKYMLSTNVMIQPWAEQVHAMEFAVTVGMSRSF